VQITMTRGTTAQHQSQIRHQISISAQQCPLLKLGMTKLHNCFKILSRFRYYVRWCWHKITTWNFFACENTTSGRFLH